MPQPFNRQRGFKSLRIEKNFISNNSNVSKRKFFVNGSIRLYYFQCQSNLQNVTLFPICFLFVYLFIYLPLSLSFALTTTTSASCFGFDLYHHSDANSYHNYKNNNKNRMLQSFYSSNLSLYSFAHAHSSRSRTYSSRTRRRGSQAATEYDSTSSSLLFKFGLLSDVQYAIQPEIGASRSGKPRYYKDALVKYQNALIHWAEEDCLFGIHLGDFLDGHNHAKNTSSLAMERLIKVKDKHFHGRDIYHTIGNHCLYNFNRKELRHHLGLNDCHPNEAKDKDIRKTDIGEEDEDKDKYKNGNVNKRRDRQTSPLYYSRIYRHGNLRLKFIFLDGYAESIMAEDKESIANAKKILGANNKNVENFNSPDGLEGLQRRFVAFGGGLGEKQLKWLDQQLTTFSRQGQDPPQQLRPKQEQEEEQEHGTDQCIVCVHQGVHPESCIPMCLLWDYDKLIQILTKHSKNISAVLSGHAHRGGNYFCKETNIHYKVLEAVLETKPGENAHGIVNVFNDKIVIQGEGSVSDSVIHFPL